MKIKLSIFASFAILFGFGALWSINNGVEIAMPYIQENVRQTASVESTRTESKQTENNKQFEAISNNTSNNTKTEKTNEISVIIGGDLMMDRAIRLFGEKNGYDALFASITSLFNSADIVAVNLEGPITSNLSKTLLANNSMTDSFTFTFDPKTAIALAQAHITAISLANNHADNFGAKGLEETKRLLSEVGIQYFGNPWNKSPVDIVVSKNGGNVAFVGYHAFQKGFPGIVARVKELSKQDNFVIVMPHWGNEYSSKPTEMMKGQARELVSAGANAIIGSHSHVIGENEWIGTVPVYYSLGNLLFDQYFSPETMKGELVELHLIVQNGKTVFDNLKIIEVSNASRKGIEVIED
ncbi:MAG: CapA family protein [Patescibacteria group bacterium]